MGTKFNYKSYLIQKFDSTQKISRTFILKSDSKCWNWQDSIYIINNSTIYSVNKQMRVSDTTIRHPPYRNSEVLRKHLKKKHGIGRAPLPCPVCSRLMSSSAGLELHMRKEHSTEQLKRAAGLWKFETGSSGFGWFLVREGFIKPESRESSAIFSPLVFRKICPLWGWGVPPYSVNYFFC